jgi:CBS domain containing-hemolysin-like protein
LDEEEVCGKLYVKVIDIQNSRIGKVEIRKENKKK